MMYRLEAVGRWSDMKPPLVMTAGVNDRVAEDGLFAKAVADGLARFARADWGDLDAEDKRSNDADLVALNGGDYGRILAAYGDEAAGTKFWIIRDTEAITILFPSEY